MKLVIVRSIVMGLFGTALMSLFSGFEAHYEVLRFSYRTWQGLPQWLPFYYAGVFLFISLLYPWLESRWNPPYQISFVLFSIETLTLIAIFLGPIYIQSVYPHLPSFILLFYLFFRLGFFYQKWDWLFLLGGITFGLSFIRIFIAFDLFQYHKPQLLGLPLWLPIQWALFGLISRRFNAIFKTKPR